MLNTRVTAPMFVLCVFLARPCVCEDALTKARREAAVRKEAKEAIDALRTSDRNDGEKAREKLLIHLTVADETLTSLRSALDRWRDHVEPLLSNEAGRRIASDAELRDSFVSVYSELASEYAKAKANCRAAEQLYRETRKFLDEHNKNSTAYSPSYKFTQRLSEVFDEIELTEPKFAAAVTKFELWTQIAANRDPSENSLGDFLKPKPLDARSPSQIGRGLIAMRNLAYSKTAKEFAATLTREAGQKRGAEQVRTIGAMSGKIVSERNQPTLSVTLQIKQRERSTFSGSMFLNTGDDVSRLSGRISGDQFHCSIGASAGVLALDGTIDGDEVSGTWKSSGRGRDYGTFRFTLTRIE